MLFFRHVDANRYHGQGGRCENATGRLGQIGLNKTRNSSKNNRLRISVQRGSGKAVQRLRCLQEASRLQVGRKPRRRRLTASSHKSTYSVKHLAMILLLSVLGVTAWGMTHVVYRDASAVASTNLSQPTDNGWRRTVNGWERLPLNGGSPRDFEPHLHPAVVAFAQLFAGLFSLLALSRRSKAKDSKVVGNGPGNVLTHRV